MEHPEPDAVHTSFTQQPPLPHAPKLQQGSPGPPQATHVPSPAMPPPEQIMPEVVHVRPAQQVSPAVPHATVEVAVEVTVTVMVTVPVFVPVPVEVRVCVLVRVVVMVNPLELLEQPPAPETRVTTVSRPATKHDGQKLLLFVLICPSKSRAR